MKTFTKNEVVTIISISDFMGNTVKSVYKATGEEHNGKPVFKENKKGARKTFTLRDFKDDTLVFSGEVPFKVDSEIQYPSTNGFTHSLVRGNACLNLVGDPAVIKDYVLYKNLNENFKRLDEVIICDEKDENKETPLFPQVETSHAVVQRIRDKINQ